MNCKEFHLLASAFIDNELSSQDVVKVNNHLRECANCRKYLESMRMIDEAFKKPMDNPSIKEFAENKMIIMNTLGLNTKYEKKKKNLFAEILDYLKAYPLRLALVPAAVLIIAFIMIKGRTKELTEPETSSKFVQQVEKKDSFKSTLPDQSPAEEETRTEERNGFKPYKKTEKSQEKDPLRRETSTGEIYKSADEMKSSDQPKLSVEDFSKNETESFGSQKAGSAPVTPSLARTPRQMYKIETPTAPAENLDDQNKRKKDIAGSKLSKDREISDDEESSMETAKEKPSSIAQDKGHRDSKETYLRTSFSSLSIISKPSKYPADTSKKRSEAKTGYYSDKSAYQTAFIADIYISSRGKVEKVILIQSTGDKDMDRNFVSYLMDFKFKPYYSDGSATGIIARYSSNDL
ncbi:MAG: zf-HC2 domain-containing protein [Candidatus Coatesbacteria bacterium]|nr:zf-HC2 domain-containing protein [Candidatus Coatesbacteria bacterium]